MSNSRQLNTIPLLLLSIFVLLLITGCNSSSKKIGVNGGVVTSNDGLLKLIIPAGSLLNATEISLESITPDFEVPGEGLKRFYQAKPDGLTFATPAILEADVSEFIDSPNLPIILSASNTQGADVLGNQEIISDFENGTSTIRGEVTHFSIFSVLNSYISVEIKGLPLSAPANSPINSVELLAKITNFNNVDQSSVTVSTLNFFDSSIAPVFFSEPTNPVKILEEVGLANLNISDISNNVIYPLDYRCGDPGFGEFDGTVTISGLISVLHVQDEGGFALLFFGSGTSQTETVLRDLNQTFRGKRIINCVGEETTEPTDPPGEPETPVSSLTIDEAEISFVHVKMVSPCPQEIKTVTITNSGNAATDVALSSSTIALSTDTATFSLAPGESKEVTISFTCNPPESFVGTINFNGNNTSATLTVNGVIQ